MIYIQIELYQGQHQIRLTNKSIRKYSIQLLQRTFLYWETEREGDFNFTLKI